MQRCSPLGRVILLCAVVRTVYLGFFLLLDWCFEDYDTSVDLLALVDDGGQGPPIAPVAAAAGGPLARTTVWDAVFVTRIAGKGYEYEQYYAFFPVVPGVLRAGVWVTRGLLSLPAIGLLLSLVSTVAAAAALYRLSEDVVGDPRLAATSALLFACNPASPFYTGPAYTEGLFAACSFTGQWLLMRDRSQTGGGQPRRQLMALAALVGAAAIRANGVLHAGFLVHRLLQLLVGGGAHHHHHGSTSNSSSAVSLAHKATAAVGTLAGCAMVAAPSILFQLAGAAAFCGTADAGGRGGGGSGGDGQVWPRPWCSTKGGGGGDGGDKGLLARLPLPRLYGFVQSQYWGVGPLRYWRLQQAPNFALAAPVLLFTACGCWTYLSYDWRRAITGGVLPRTALRPARQQQRQRRRLCHAKGWDDGQGEARGEALGDGRRASMAAGEVAQEGAACAYFSDAVCPFVLQWGAMALVALVVMHVQVATRFLSSCAPMYWYAAHLCCGSCREDEGEEGTKISAAIGNGGGEGGRHSGRSRGGGHQSTWRLVVWGYCLGYATLGALMFVNFYPWT